MAEREDPLARSIAPPHVLREYALLADGERGVLVGPRGEFSWLCFPTWHGDALFASLIGGGGTYSVTPAGRFVWGGYYEHGLIWCSRWITDAGQIVESREALALPTRPDRAVVLRRVLARAGGAKVRVVLDARSKYGEKPAGDLRRDDEGRWTARAGDASLCWVGAADAQPVDTGDGGQALTFELELEEGRHHDLVLAIGRGSDPPEAPEATAAWQGTEAAWDARIPGLENTIGRRDARHAVAVLSGLTSAGGGMVAAATTSLPERARQGRSYDYRYVWIRDQCYTGRAGARSGALALLDDAVRFVTARLLDDGPQLKPAYTIDGEDVPDERQLDLPGYPGGTDIVGNWVNSQFQLDAFGEALLLLRAAADHDRLDADGWRALETAVDAIAERWREADAGVWELDPDEWTHSRLICAAGLREASQCQPRGQTAARWLTLADEIVADTARRALHPSGRWQRSPTDERLDAALLLPGLRGAIPADDPRTLATLRAVEHELGEDGFAYRYRPDERPLGESEGAFLLCGFWLSLAWSQQGDHVRAVRWFERNRSACGPPGLLAEEFDVEQRQLRGNLPQAFVHALLLECAATLHDAGAVDTLEE